MGAKVYLVGAGPGNPGLLTVRGRELLGRADVVVYDASCDGLLREVPPEAERVPVGRWPDAVVMPQKDVNRLLVDRARRGMRVVRLKGGDPFLFGRGDEEAEALAEAAVGFEVVPGVTSGLAAAACAGIPLTRREIASSVVFAIIQKGSSPREWGLDAEHLARSEATLVLYLDPSMAGGVAAELIRAGRSPQTPVAIVEAAGGPTQRTFEGVLADIGERARAARPPAVAIVGAAVALRSKVAWAEKRLLAGRSVVITRPRAQAAAMVALLEEEGAEIIELPCIAIGPPESWEPLDRAIGELGTFDWVVFSSANGVERFLERLLENGRDARALGTTKVAAVGPATAQALREARLVADAVPSEHNAEALAKVLGANAAGKRFAIVRAQEGREIVADELRRRGARVEVVPAYRTVRPPIDSAFLRLRLAEGRVSAIAFASPSAVKSFVAAFEPGEAAALLEGVCVAAIGPVSARAAREQGLQVDVMPDDSTGVALVEALVRRLGKKEA